MLSYCNPVFSGYFADPFVLFHDNQYWAYGTEARVPHESPQTRVFGVLRSSDLAHWTECEGALEQLKPPLGWSYWAPEVCYRDGTFWMFYSTSGKSFRGKSAHHLRVAKSDSPAGPFRDCKTRIFPDEEFSIDAHPFQDPNDGRWYLFFARNDLNYERLGTGISVAPLRDDMLGLDGEATWALRPHADWHIWGKNRKLHGGKFPAWHTLEGPFVLYRDGRYVMFYSGGSWETPGYGVSYAVANHPLGPWRDEWSAGGPQVLQGVAPHAIGPGHNSVVQLPNGRDMMIYHAWDEARTARRLCIDPIAWTSDGPKVQGPTWTEQTL